MGKSVTLADIGKRAGVSAVTVSKALSGQSGVSEEMRRTILRLADEMNYKKVAKAAPVNTTPVMGVIVSERFLEESQSYYWKLYQGLSTVAVKEGCLAVLETVTVEEEEELVMPKVLSEKKADGLIVLGLFHRKYMRFINSQGTPKVYLDSHLVGELCDAVVSDNETGSCLLTDKLFELGHRDIGFVGTSRTTTCIDERLLGYVRSHLTHDVNVIPEWIIDDRDRKTGKISYEEQFKLPDKLPTAFVCNCDLSATLLIRKLKERGLSVPEDISVTGFDNFIPGVDIKNDLYTYENDLDSMVMHAVLLLKQKISHIKNIPSVITVSGRIIPGKSVRRIGPPVPFV